MSFHLREIFWEVLEVFTNKDGDKLQLRGPFLQSRARMYSEQISDAGAPLQSQARNASEKLAGAVSCLLKDPAQILDTAPQGSALSERAAAYVVPVGASTRKSRVRSNNVGDNDTDMRNASAETREGTQETVVDALNAGSESIGDLCTFGNASKRKGVENGDACSLELGINMNATKRGGPAASVMQNNSCVRVCRTREDSGHI